MRNKCILILLFSLVCSAAFAWPINGTWKTKGGDVPDPLTIGEITVTGDASIGGDLEVDGVVYGNSGAEFYADTTIYGVVGLGVGVANPLSELHVNGTIRMQGASGNCYYSVRTSCEAWETALGVNNGYYTCKYCQAN